MRKKSRSKTVRELIIDLTPLLDVIFIILLIVLATGDVYSQSAEGMMADAQEESRNAQQIRDDAEQKVAAYQTQIEAYESIDDYFSIITVSAGYDIRNRRNRTIRIKINDNDDKIYELNPSNTKDRTNGEWAKIKAFIEERIAADPDLPVILALNMKNEDKMLYRDQEEILLIFDDLRTKYSNVTIKM
ncbi:MAG: hypothetical protein J5824_01125 [Lachnospiraceae bacterium]|nr:hypothetical protein [Lachnospiraceae bacterium]